MKKSIIFMGCLALLVAGCNKEQNIEAPTPETPRHLSFNITVDNDFDTRAVKTDWESGDKVYVVFDHFFTDDANTAVYYMTMTYDNGSWDCAFSDSALENYLLGQTEGTLTALYLPFGNPVFSYNSSRNQIEFDLFRPESNTTKVASSYYSSCDRISYSVEDGVLSASLNMRVPLGFVQFFIEGVPESEVANYVLTNEYFSFCRASHCAYFASSTSSYPSHPYWDATISVLGKPIDGFYYKNGILFSGSLTSDARGVEKTYSITIVDNRGTTTTSDDITYTLKKEATLNACDAVKLPALDSGKWEINGFKENLDEGYFTYDGVKYNVVKMKDGKWWMAQNLAYLPEGYTPATDLSAVTAGIFAPIQVNAGHTAAEFTTDAAVVASNGYLYQAEVALGLKVGDLTSVADAEKLEGAQGICPMGWHVPTIADITGLVGKAVSPIVTNTEAPYYDGANGSIPLLNVDGFNMAAVGSVSIQDNTKTTGTFMGFMSAYSDHLTSGMFCGSTYAGVTYNTSGDETSGVKNLQFYGFMPMTNKSSEAQYTCNGTKVSYRIAAPVRCVRN
jgi:uncharacterized protein (TIGR02145 family)